MQEVGVLRVAVTVLHDAFCELLFAFEFLSPVRINVMTFGSLKSAKYLFIVVNNARKASDALCPIERIVLIESCGVGVWFLYKGLFILRF